MIDKLMFDLERGKKIAELLWNKGKDLFCKEKLMPEDKALKRFPKNPKEIVLFLTFTVAIDYQRDAEKLWEAARETYEDPETNYLFNPQILSQTSIEKIREDLKRKGVPLRYPDKDPKFWKKLGETFYYKWNGNPFNLFEKYKYDAQKIFWEEI